MKRLLISGFVLAAFLLSCVPAFAAEQAGTTVKHKTVKHKKGKKLKKKKVSSMEEIDKPGTAKAKKTSKKTAKKQKKVKASSTENLK